MQESPLSIRAGHEVRVRRQRWRVEAIAPDQNCRVVTLAGIEPHNVGRRISVLTPFDDVEPLQGSWTTPRLVGIRRWRRCCRALVAADGPADALRTAASSRIDLLPHQLEPAMALLAGLGSRVLIADDVGLGKTIQAALIVGELQARGAIERVLILAPAGLRDQWADELSERFHLAATVVDAADARRRAAALPTLVNPWSTLRLAIASLDFVKRPEVLPAVAEVRWDLIVVDEAHGVTPGSDRHAAVSRLSGAAPYLVLLTATPHSGDRTAFASLCSLGERGDRLLVFRRSRQEAEPRPASRIRRLMVRPTDAEQRLHEILGSLAARVRAEQGSGDRWLAFTVLHKRALSSARSLALSLERRLAALDNVKGSDGEQLGLPLDDANGEQNRADEPPVCDVPMLADPAEERRVLAALLEAAHDAARRESKLIALKRLLARIGARRERAIVFTEYRDTLEHVRSQVAPDAAALHGGLTRDERRRVVREFCGGHRPVLLSTDAGAEGLNLHHSCRTVINLELPWSPTPLEQRAGRVDRIGQRLTVHVIHLIARGTWETTVLERLHAKIAVARSEVGAPDPLGIPDSSGEALPAGSTTRLVEVGLRERDRLMRARALIASRHGPAGIELLSGPLVTATRRRRTRAALHGRVLVVLRSRFEDVAGRVAALRLTPLVFRSDPRAIWRPKELLDVLRQAIPVADIGLVDAGWRTWASRSEETLERFWRARRERELGAAPPCSAPASLQPGLFDRRAEREWQSLQQDQAEAAREAARRAAVVDLAASVSLSPPEISLVLIPGRVTR